MALFGLAAINETLTDLHCYNRILKKTITASYKLVSMHDKAKFIAGK